MAFDPSKYKAPSAKPLPVILLLDSSGSMNGAKINNLNEAVREMISDFADNSTSEVEINVAVISFGEKVLLLTPDDKPYVKASKLKDNPPTLSARGQTPLGIALKMAKDMIDDKTVTPSPCYKPAIVLVSDGRPDNGWECPFSNFVDDGRSSKCQRLAVGIGIGGDDYAQDVLKKFVSDSSLLFEAENADQIKKALQFVTNSVSVRAKSSNPNIVPIVSNATFDRASTVGDDDEEPEF